LKIFISISSLVFPQTLNIIVFVPSPESLKATQFRASLKFGEKNFLKFRQKLFLILSGPPLEKSIIALKF